MAKERERYCRREIALDRQCDKDQNRSEALIALITDAVVYQHRNDNEDD